MTEYWKSQARKYCEFCKCWFADNKVSISFHENGKRHKESVQKHISQLSKKSAKEFKQKEKIDDEMKKMESAAMAAYLKDVKNNGDLTSKVINEMVEKSGGSAADITLSCNANKSSHDWQEIKNDSGRSYFWNKKTNETTWDPPDNYLSITEQEKQKLKKEEPDIKKEKKVKKSKKKDGSKDMGSFVESKKLNEMTFEKSTTFGPSRPINPYGSWTPVVSEVAESIDLQLPKSDKELPPPPVVMEPEVVHFKEKRIESLGDGPVEFKKRKLNNPKRNMRQKVDDD